VTVENREHVGLKVDVNDSAQSANQSNVYLYMNNLSFMIQISPTHRRLL